VSAVEARTSGWPRTPEALDARQAALASLARAVQPWVPPEGHRPLVAGAFVCLPTGVPDREVRAGDPAWAAAAVMQGRRVMGTSVVRGVSGAPYVPGRLALQQGPILEAAVRALDVVPEVVLVNATGRDHPRAAGLALHLGAVLDLPTVGVTDRPLVARGPEPGTDRGAAAPLELGGEVVGFQVRTRPGTRPLCVHAAWRTDPDTARRVVLAATARLRTPEPLRRARRLARVARAEDEGRLAG
jgi:deoxyribonuclease V